jgi:hypothetical protein
VSHAFVQVSPRANIFRRDQGNVHALEDLKHLMRYNDFQNDDFSNGQPVASVCARGDLAKKGAIPKGCYDTKVRALLPVCCLYAACIRPCVAFCCVQLVVEIMVWLWLLTHKGISPELVPLVLRVRLV